MKAAIFGYKILQPLMPYFPDPSQVMVQIHSIAYTMPVIRRRLHRLSLHCQRMARTVTASPARGSSVQSAARGETNQTVPQTNFIKTQKQLSRRRRPAPPFPSPAPPHKPVSSSHLSPVTLRRLRPPSHPSTHVPQRAPRLIPTFPASAACCSPPRRCSGSRAPSVHSVRWTGCSRQQPWSGRR